MSQLGRSSKNLITLENGAPPACPPITAELAFLVDGARRWDLRADMLGDDCADALAQAVAATPKALEWHLRRIHYAHAQRRGDELYAALLDLFIVLGGRGRALRRRLLAGARDLLGPDESDALRRGVDEGQIPPESELPRTLRSRLCEGVQGMFELVRVNAPRASQLRDPLVEARECIEYSQLDHAREILEKAVIDDPQREDLHLELLSLYRATRDGTNFGRMKERLQKLLGSLPVDWSDLDLPTGGGHSS